jgi:hypothetical protein
MVIIVTVFITHLPWSSLMDHAVFLDILYALNLIKNILLL